MLDSKITSAIGFILLLAVVFVSILDRGSAQINYFDWHAAIVVVGGVCGSLLVAFRGSTFVMMMGDWLRVIAGRDASQRAHTELMSRLLKMEKSWQEGRRSEVLNLATSDSSEVIRMAAEALVQHVNGARLAERFESLRQQCMSRLLPQIDGWDMVARLGPSFGIVGTVAGMVHLFRNMNDHSGNLGGAMALALLATLYGILIGTAVGGPMSSRVNSRMNEEINLIDLLERKTAALIEEGRTRPAVEKNS